MSGELGLPGVGATTISGSASMSSSHSAQTRATTAESGVKTSTCHEFARIRVRFSWDGLLLVEVIHSPTNQTHRKLRALHAWPSAHARGLAA